MSAERLRDEGTEVRRVPAKDTALYQGAVRLIERQDRQLVLMRAALAGIAATPDVSVWIQSLAVAGLEKAAEER
jgi:hypothetical protein